MGMNALGVHFKRISALLKFSKFTTDQSEFKVFDCEKLGLQE